MKIVTEGKEVQMQQTEAGFMPLIQGDFSVEKLTENQLLIIANGNTFTATLISMSREDKTMRILMNNTVYEAMIKEPLDELLHNMGMDNSQNTSVTSIKAPMPGLVLDVAVQPGASVSKGDKLVVLEAMKMENVIKSSGDGTVARILVKKGETVDKNQILVEFS